MRNILLIAKREYLQQIRGRAFKLSTILVPLLMAVLMGASLLTGWSSIRGKHVVIAADNAALADQVRREMLFDTKANYTVDVIAPATSEDRAVLQGKLRSRAVDGVLYLETSATGTIAATYNAPYAGGYVIVGGLQNALDRALVRERLLAAGMKDTELDATLRWVPIETPQPSKNGKATKSNGVPALYKAMTMALLLTVPIILYGMDMARSIIDEKSSRIFEVMLAVARPDDLLAGKLLGVGAVGLTQIGIWMIVAVLVTGSALAGPLLSGNFALHFSLAEVLLFPVYFVLGFCVYSAFFSGLAATCETAQELQMYMPLAVVPVWFSFGFLPFLLTDSNSALAVAASLFPVTSPFVMIPRMGMEMPPVWQFVVSIALLLVNIWVALWFSSRLYRVGILMYGKRATLPELLRWLRYS
jgi:ABC-2 type transport system permease protein